jgi:hypothetical protein
MERERERERERRRVKDWFDGIRTQPQLIGVGFGQVRPVGNRACGEKNDFGRNILHLTICMGLLPFPPQL